MTRQPPRNLAEGTGRLVPSDRREGSWDLVGELRINGKVILLRGWVLRTDRGAELISLSAREARA